MTKKTRGRITLEALSTIGVAIGLVFVGLELRHSNNLSQAEALISLNGLTITMEMSRYEMPTSDDLWVRFRDGKLDNDDDISPKDEEILTTYYVMLINLTEAAWKFRDTGILGEAETQGYLKSACNSFTRNDLGINFWQTSRGNFTSGFIAELETICVDLKSID